MVVNEERKKKKNRFCLFRENVPKLRNWNLSDASNSFSKEIFHFGKMTELKNSVKHGNNNNNTSYQVNTSCLDFWKSKEENFHKACNYLTLRMIDHRIKIVWTNLYHHLNARVRHLNRSRCYKQRLAGLGTRWEDTNLIISVNLILGQLAGPKKAVFKARSDLRKTQYREFYKWPRR